LAGQNVVTFNRSNFSIVQSVAWTPWRKQLMHLQ
jgi:hypothetical protein